MRPRSIVGPMLLIGLGVLLLLRNVWPEIPFFTLFSKYWPYLLILWGTVRLGEVLFWRVNERPLPANGIGGGEWTLVVILCLLGATAHWGNNRTWPGMRISNRTLDVLGESYEFPVKLNVPGGKAPRIVLELGRGDVKVVGGEGDLVQISGHQSVRAYNQEEANAENRKAQVTMEKVGDRVIIRTNQDKLSERRATAMLEILVPKGSSFEGRGKYGDFDINDLAGSVEVTSDNAGVRVRNIQGPVRVELKRSDIIRATGVKGPLELRGKGQEVELEDIDGQVTVNGAYTGELTFRKIAKPLRFEGTQTQFRAEKIGGSIQVRPGGLMLEDVDGPVRISGKTRDVQVAEFRGELELEVENGDLELRPGAGAGKVSAKTRNGNIDLILGTASKFDLTGRTERGEVHNEYGSPLKEESSGRGARLTGGNGGPTMELTTERGHITVRKGSAITSVMPSRIPSTPAAPAAPPPPIPATVQQ